MNKFEGSKKDMAQDAKLAKKYKMSPKEYEKSSVDAKHDKQKSMAGLKHGGSMYASGGTVTKDGKGPEGMRGMGGKGPEGMRERMRGMMRDKLPEGMRERMRSMGAERPAGMPPARHAGMPMARPAVMPARPGMAKGGMAKGGMPMEMHSMPVRPGMAKGGMAKGGMAKDGVASKGKTSTKMVKMASGGSFRSSANGIASKGKTKGRMC
jgi:hypothetical protein